MSAGEPSEAVVVAGNRLTLLETGDARLAAILDLIDGAQVSLKLYFYMFASDITGHRVRDALIDAVRRDVHVTLIVDAFGSNEAAAGFFDPLAEAGGHFAWFGTRRSTRYLIRNHQKLAIADDARLITGGFNIADAYVQNSGKDCWHDLGLILTGPAVDDMVTWYARVERWTAGKQGFRALRAMVRHWHPDQKTSVHWLVGGPVRMSSLAWQVKHDLEQAKQLDMVQAYFSPGPAMLRRIGRIAQRGTARVLLASRSDNAATVAAARFLYPLMLRRGVAVHEYLPCLLHMKLMVLDDAVYIGSANFDRRSLFINLELVLRVEDADFAARMRCLVDRSIADSERVTRESHAARTGPLMRIKNWISYLLVGVLDYSVTRRLNFRSLED